ncbi:autotransporter secretion outer membrane protein TamA [Thiogranum longum]|uniref:Translocation and assembly module subunit TamA n=1 Tax=Thiogranum longum TaxID=1537524 RepID=A0A4R1HP85_9GAMM|nr:autotransporter assembly complex family protein [Thiogranum longum]TCK19092.1 autotransporter secretion outer membrane protein TamA [Thiogranum longum]
MKTINTLLLNHFVLVTLLVLPCVVFANGTVIVKGVDKALEANIRAMLSLEQEACDAPQWRMQVSLIKAESEIREALQAFGYYQPVINQTYRKKGKSNCWTARFDIQPGKRVILRDINIAITGEAGRDENFQKLIDKTGLRPGLPLRHDDYESLKSGITNLAAERGYFDSRFTVHELRVDPVSGYADINLRFESGVRFRFGETRAAQDIIDDKLLRRYLGYRKGEPYVRTALTETSLALSGSGYFAQVLVQPLIDEAEGHEVPVRITLTPANRHRYTLSTGFATDTGPRLGAGYKNLRLNRKGHQLSSDLSLSTVISRVTFAYTLPLEHPVTDKMRFEAGYKQENTDSYRADTTAVSVTRTRQLKNRWLEEQVLEYSRESFKISGDLNDSSSLLMPGIGWSKSVADNPLYPRRGFRLNFTTRGSLQGVASDISFLQLIGGAKGILGLPWQTRLIGRFDGGSTFMNKFDALPPSVRFFAGGDSSVRGYGYKSLGPDNASGEVEGGKHLLVGSLELDHRITEKWGLAAFVDTGNAFNDLPVDLKTGVGLGIRWRSPVGPVRLDFARPLDRKSNQLWVHFVMGPDL